MEVGRRQGDARLQSIWIDGVTSRSISMAVSIRGRPNSGRSFGMAWGVGGWLLFSFLQKIGATEAQKLRERVVAELKTTFASHYPVFTIRSSFASVQNCGRQRKKLSPQSIHKRRKSNR